VILVCIKFVTAILAIWSDAIGIVNYAFISPELHMWSMFYELGALLKDPSVSLELILELYTLY